MQAHQGAMHTPRAAAGPGVAPAVSHGQVPAGPRCFRQHRRWARPTITSAYSRYGADGSREDRMRALMDNGDDDEEEAAANDAAVPQQNSSQPLRPPQQPGGEPRWGGARTDAQQPPQKQPGVVPGWGQASGNPGATARGASDGSAAAAAAAAAGAAAPSGRAASGPADEQWWDDWGGGGAQPQAGSSQGQPSSQEAAASGQGQSHAAADDVWDEADGEPPDITGLSVPERDAMLRVAPFKEQVDFFRADPARSVQQWAGAALLTLLASAKLPLLAAGTVSFPFWWPWVQAANKNRAVLAQYKNVGLWRARALGVEVRGRRMPRFSDPAENTRPAPAPMQPYLHLLAGDDSGARTELVVPFVRGYESIHVGEPVELLVVAPRASFAGFKALKEAYLPESNLWLADYPYVSRDAFLDLSLTIERERAAAAAEAAQPTGRRSAAAAGTAVRF